MIKTFLLKPTLPLALLCLALLPSAPARAQDKAAPLSPAEKTFIAEAYAGGLSEVKMGELAKTKATGTEAKALAERLVTDHRKADEALRKLAMNHGVTLPTEPPAAEQTAYQSLEKKQGAQFDKAFARHATKDHKKDIAKFEKAAKKATAADLKAFIDQTLPVLKEHLALAQAAGGKEK
ncbi:MAG TPA: DUF4142 domain-containing protein [Chthoniobacteraceae bacterium]|nr:DUF4142 domain-containing protein [Chthoniobacteraceae bacterium]